MPYSYLAQIFYPQEQFQVDLNLMIPTLQQHVDLHESVIRQYLAGGYEHILEMFQQEFQRAYSPEQASALIAFYQANPWAVPAQHRMSNQMIKRIQEEWLPLAFQALSEA